jgi:hypothetical protein
MLVRCLYASRSTEAPADRRLDRILEQSRRNNPRAGITGLLCSANDVFVQMLEGGRGEVSALFNRISTDPRHRDVTLLAFVEISERRFGNWTMGQVPIDNVNRALLLKYSEKPELDPFRLPAAATMALLEEFASSGAIMGRTA